MLVAFIEYLAKFFGPIRDLSAKYTIMQQAMAAAERVFGLLDTDEPDAPARRRPRPRSRRARRARRRRRAPLDRARRVTFGYRADRPVLRDVSLRSGAGETVAVVGATGSGKSTHHQAAAAPVRALAGAIRLGGVDVRDLDRRALRRRIVVVSQDVFLFAGTLRDNIGLGDPAPSTTSASWRPRAASAPTA